MHLCHVEGEVWWPQMWLSFGFPHPSELLCALSERRSARDASYAGELVAQLAERR